MKSRRQRRVSSDSDSPQEKKPKLDIKVNKKNEEEDDDGSSSDSSLGEHLKAADEIDLDSEFFTVKPAEKEKTVSTLESDSDDSESDKEPLAKVAKKGPGKGKLSSTVKNKEQKASTPKKKLKAALNNPEDSKNINHNSLSIASTSKDDLNENAKGDDILQLLAKGESRKSTEANKTKYGSDSDWEEVALDENTYKKEESLEDDDDDELDSKITDVQITVKVGDAMRMKKKGTDLMQAIKRRINRVRKENQVLMHKVHFLSWLAHGNYVNNVLNDTELLAISLSLLPSEKCYPPDRTDFSYLEAIVKWFGQTVKIKDPNTKDPLCCTNLKEELSKQISTKSLGIKCRLVLNFVQMALKPAKEDLWSLSNNEKDKKNGASTSKVKVSESTKKSKKNDISKDKKTKQKVPAVNVGKLTTIDKNATNKKGPTVKIERLKTLDKVAKSKDNNKSIDTKKKDSVESTKDKNKEKGTKSTKNSKQDSSKSTSTDKSKSDKTIASKLKEKSNRSSSRRSDANSKDNKESRMSGIEQKSSKDDKALKKSGSEKKSSKDDDKLTTKLVNGKKESKNNKETANEKIKTKETTKTENPDLSKVPKTLQEEVEKAKRENERRKSKIEIVQSFSKSPKKDSLEAVKERSKSTSSPRVQLQRLKLKTGEKERSKSASSIAKPNKNRNENDKGSRSSGRNKAKISQLDGHDDEDSDDQSNFKKSKKLNLSNLKKNTRPKKPVKYKHFTSSEEEFQTDEDEEFVPGKGEISSEENDEDDDDEDDIDEDDVVEEDDDFKPQKKRSSSFFNKKKSSSSSNSKYPGSIPPSKAGAVTNAIIELMKQRIQERRDVERIRKIKVGKLKKGAKNDGDDDDYDSDYVAEETLRVYKDNDFKDAGVKVKKRVNPKANDTNRKALSSDSEYEDEDEKKKKPASPVVEKRKKGIDVWVEVFLEAEEKWICVDILKGQVHCVSQIYSRASTPVNYIIAWNNDQTIKDVSRRYCAQFSTTTLKLRAESEWVEKSMQPFQPKKKTAKDKEEDEELAKAQMDAPLPKTVGEYKNHPLYVLRRHLLKFQGIYPPDAVTLGFIRDEPVYSRDCVYTLHSREIWVKHAKVVKAGEKPYKIVKARPKYDRLSGQRIADQNLELFGPWQVGDYVPPTAENGIVPRNAYGNVELFKECMLPKGCVHLRLPGLNKVARKLGIDCAQAVTGFDFHGGFSHATFDGFVVCEEYQDQLVGAWYVEQEEIERREQEKMEKRVYGNWKRLIKGLLIRERLKLKYNYGAENEEEINEEVEEPEASTSASTKSKEKKSSKNTATATKSISNKKKSTNKRKAISSSDSE